MSVAEESKLSGLRQPTSAKCSWEAEPRESRLHCFVTERVPEVLLIKPVISTSWSGPGLWPCSTDRQGTFAGHQL